MAHIGNYMGIRVYGPPPAEAKITARLLKKHGIKASDLCRVIVKRISGQGKPYYVEALAARANAERSECVFFTEFKEKVRGHLAPPGDVEFTYSLVKIDADTAATKIGWDDAKLAWKALSLLCEHESCSVVRSLLSRCLPYIKGPHGMGDGEKERDLRELIEDAVKMSPEEMEAFHLYEQIKQRVTKEAA